MIDRALHYLHYLCGARQNFIIILSKLMTYHNPPPTVLKTGASLIKSVVAFYEKVWILYVYAF